MLILALHNKIKWLNCYQIENIETNLLQTKIPSTKVEELYQSLEIDVHIRIENISPDL